MEKHRADGEEYDFPAGGQTVTAPLRSEDGRESFLLDLTRGRIKLSKVTMQNRARQVVVLARLDVDGPPHRNPDDQEVPCPHLHIYREGYGDKWALPIPRDRFSDPADLGKTLDEFMKYCNITVPPHIEMGILP